MSLDTIVLAQRGEFQLAAGFSSGQLYELIVTSSRVAAGDVIGCKLQRALPGQAGAFVTLAGGEVGYLQASGDTWPSRVAVLRPAYRDKRAFVSAKITYPGRWLVFTPDIAGVNLSRRLKPAGDFAPLRAALQEFGGGWIVRSSAAGQGLKAILHEARALQGIAEATFGAAHQRALRDWDITATANIWVDEASHQPIMQICTRFGWEDYGHLLQQTADVWGLQDLDSRLRTLTQRRVELGGSAWMSIDITEGLTVIDINTGNDFSPGAMLKANLLAAAQIPRQIALRGLGGVVIIDPAGFLTAEQRDKFAQIIKAGLGAGQVDAKGWGPTGQFHLVFPHSGRPLIELWHEGLDPDHAI